MNEIRPNFSGLPTRRYTFEDLRLEVGDRLQISVPTQDDPIAAKLLGYLQGESLMIRPAAGVTLGSYPLGEGDMLTVRGFSGRLAFGFQSEITKIRYVPYAYCHLRFPSAIVGMEIRHAERVQVDIPVRVDGAIGTAGHMVEASIANISTAGARLLSKDVLGVNGNPITLNFRFWLMPNQYEVNLQVTAVIQTVTLPEDGRDEIATGVRFGTIRTSELVLLQNLIYQRLHEGSKAIIKTN